MASFPFCLPFFLSFSIYVSYPHTHTHIHTHTHTHTHTNTHTHAKRERQREIKRERALHGPCMAFFCFYLVSGSWLCWVVLCRFVFKAMWCVCVCVCVHATAACIE